MESILCSFVDHYDMLETIERVAHFSYYIKICHIDLYQIFKSQSDHLPYILTKDTFIYVT